jgi:hypothetical protein
MIAIPNQGNPNTLDWAGFKALLYRSLIDLDIGAILKVIATGKVGDPPNPLCKGGAGTTTSKGLNILMPEAIEKHQAQGNNKSKVLQPSDSPFLRGLGGSPTPSAV